MKSKKILTLLLSSAILATSAAFMPGNKVYAATADTAATIDRLQGTDRYGTAIAISKAGWQTSDNVILATGGDFPDALSAAPLAKQLNAPILLVGKTLDSNVLSELDRLKVKKIFIVGGQGVISKDIEDALKAKQIVVTRLSGVDRYDTSLKIADYITTNFKTDSQVVVATGENFPDALSIAPIAAAKGMPIILTQKNAVSEEIKSYIAGKKFTKAFVIGGSGVVSDDVLKQLPNSERVSGLDRYKTNIAILNKFSSDLDFNEAYVATGEDFPDALAGSALASFKGAPIVLTGDTPDAATSAFISSKIDSIGKIKVLGGEGAVKSSAYQRLVVDTIQLNDLLKAVSNTANIKSMEGKSQITLKLDVNGLPQEEQQQINAVLPLINAAKLNITTKTNSNEDKTAVKSSIDMTLDSSAFPLQMGIWLDGDLSKDTPQFKEIIKMPAMLTAGIPEFAGKEYMVINSADLNAAQGSMGIGDYKQIAEMSKEFQGQFAKVVEGYLAEPSGHDFIAYKGAQTITTPEGSKNARVYEVKINNEILKSFLAYLGAENKDLSAIKDLNLIGDKGIVLTYYVSEDGLIISENAVIDLHIDLNKLSTLSGAIEPGTTPSEKVQGVIKAELDIHSDTYSINKSVNVDLPAVDASNSINYTDLLKYTPTK